MLRQNPDSRINKSRDNLTTQETFKRTINGYYENIKKKKSKSKKRKTNK